MMEYDAAAKWHTIAAEKEAENGRLSDDNARLRAENAKMREALEKIKQCRIIDSNGNEVVEDSAYNMRSYARAALQKGPKG